VNIRLGPELGKLIEEDIRRGPYQSVEEFVERAVSLLPEQQVWFAEHGTEIATKIEEGYAAAQRGELLDSDSVRQLMDESELWSGFPWLGAAFLSRLSCVETVLQRISRVTL
jgi:Arc/MetJ-type ribon-helix-helix transcriptional regulator